MTPWTITVGEHSFSDDDLTNSDLVAVEWALSKLGFAPGWGCADPWTSPAIALSLAAAVIARRTGDVFDHVAETLGAMKAGTVLPQPRDPQAKTEAADEAEDLVGII